MEYFNNCPKINPIILDAFLRRNFIQERYGLLRYHESTVVKQKNSFKACTIFLTDEAVIISTNPPKKITQIIFFKKIRCSHFDNVEEFPKIIIQKESIKYNHLRIVYEMEKNEKTKRKSLESKTLSLESELNGKESRLSNNTEKDYAYFKEMPYDNEQDQKLFPMELQHLFNPHYIEQEYETDNLYYRSSNSVSPSSTNDLISYEVKESEIDSIESKSPVWTLFKRIFRRGSKDSAITSNTGSEINLEELRVYLYKKNSYFHPFLTYLLVRQQLYKTLEMNAYNFHEYKRQQYSLYDSYIFIKKFQRKKLFNSASKKQKVNKYLSALNEYHKALEVSPTLGLLTLQNNVIFTKIQELHYCFASVFKKGCNENEAISKIKGYCLLNQIFNNILQRHDVSDENNIVYSYLNNKKTGTQNFKDMLKTILASIFAYPGNTLYIPAKKELFDNLTDPEKFLQKKWKQNSCDSKLMHYIIMGLNSTVALLSEIIHIYEFDKSSEVWEDLFEVLVKDYPWKLIVEMSLTQTCNLLALNNGRILKYTEVYLLYLHLHCLKFLFSIFPSINDFAVSKHFREIKKYIKIEHAEGKVDSRYPVKSKIIRYCELIREECDDAHNYKSGKFIHPSNTKLFKYYIKH